MGKQIGIDPNTLSTYIHNRRSISGQHALELLRGMIIKPEDSNSIFQLIENCPTLKKEIDFKEIAQQYFYAAHVSSNKVVENTGLRWGDSTDVAKQAGFDAGAIRRRLTKKFKGS